MKKREIRYAWLRWRLSIHIRGEFNDYIRVSGTVQPLVTIQISPIEGGMVEEILIEEGSQVKMRQSQIFGLFSLIATPIAHIVTDRWLQHFSSQIDVPVWVYLAAFAIVIALTLGIIALRTAQAAKENPVENLKSE